MSKIKQAPRPDKDFEKMLMALVYTIIAIAVSLLLLFIFPTYSLYFLLGTLGLAVLAIGISIALVSSSQKALTYGELANIVITDGNLIKRLENKQGGILLQNSAAQKFFFKEKALDILKKRLSEEPQNLPQFKQFQTAVKAFEEKTVLLELCQEEAKKWYQVSFKPISLKKNDFLSSDSPLEKIQKETCLYFILEDITAQKQIETVIQKERQNLHKFIHQMPVGIYVLDGHDCFEYVNQTFAEQLLVAEDMLRGRPFADLVAEKKSPVLNHQQVRFSGLTFLKTQENQNTQFYILQTRYQEDGQEKTRGIALKDIPSDKQLLSVLNTQKDLENFAFHLSPLGIIFADSKGKITKFNAKAESILGSPLEKARLADFFNKSDLKKMEELYSSYVRNPQSTEIFTIETTFKEEKTVRINIAPHRTIYTADNKLCGLVLYLADFTEQKSLELQFAQAQKMQAMGQLAGGVAHDFNNLLTAMIGFCDLLLQRHGIGDPSFTDLIQIKQNANRAAALVKELLAYSRKQPLNPKCLDVAENFAELNQFLKRILGEQIRLVFNHGKNLGYIKVDPVQFSQVIMNLAVNAKDAMNGKGTLTVSTHTETLTEPFTFGADTISAGDFVVISVSDTGCGIKKENLSRIFDPFFSTKQNVVGSGTGLGLSTVYGIVRQTGGFIKVESTLGVGTTFKIYLPRLENQEHPMPDAKPQKRSVTPVLTSTTEQAAPKIIFGLNVSKIDRQTESTQNTSEIKILFVEDEDSVRAFAVRALEKKGFKVTACANAEAALEQTEHFDLMVTDMVMPGINGAELSKRMKQKDKNLKIILASGYSEEIARAQLSGDEDFSFIAKPYSLGDLTKKVYDVLNGAENG